MTTPLHEAKAELFKSLGHPIRVRVLELLLPGPRMVRDLVTDTGIEPSSLSQQLAVLRRAGLVTSDREDGAVWYRLSTTDVAELMASARAILASVLTTQGELLVELQASDPHTSDPEADDATS